MNDTKHKNVIKKIAISVFWLLVWEIVAHSVSNSLLVPSILDVAKALGRIVISEGFITILITSLGRILTGLLLALMAALILATVSYVSRTVEMLLSPLVLCIKAIPIASYVILLLIWSGSKTLSIGISFLVALPIVYINLLESLKHVNSKYIEMADVFGMKNWNRVWYIYRPQVSAAMMSGVKLACGMGIKAGIAAEIIGIPEYTFGEMLYMSKIHLNMDELFAWTMVIVFSALVVEKVLLYVVEKLLRMQVPVFQKAVLPRRKSSVSQETGTIFIKNITKAYDNVPIIQNLDLQLHSGEVLGVMSPSGSGKTTLFRMLLGLEKPKYGNMDVNGRISAVFQEDLLCEDADVLTNMKLVSSGNKNLLQMANALFEENDLHKKCSLFSGGMKRRAALLRALATEFDILLLDEPFTALDKDARQKAVSLILKEAKGKTILLFTHDEEDIELLNGVCYMEGFNEEGSSDCKQ